MDSRLTIIYRFMLLDIFPTIQDEISGHHERQISVL
jgi:hypothetical protein